MSQNIQTKDLRVSPPLMAIKKWTSLSASSRSLIFKWDISPSTKTDIFGRTLSPSHSRSLIPGYCASRESIASLTLTPDTATETFRCVKLRSGAGIKIKGNDYFLFDTILAATTLSPFDIYLCQNACLPSTICCFFAEISDFIVCCTKCESSFWKSKVFPRWRQ